MASPSARTGSAGHVGLLYDFLVLIEMGHNGPGNALSSPVFAEKNAYFVLGINDDIASAGTGSAMLWCQQPAHMLSGKVGFCNSSYSKGSEPGSSAGEDVPTTFQLSFQTTFGSDLCCVMTLVPSAHHHKYE